MAGWSFLPGWFTSDAEVIAAVGSIYAFVALTQPLNAMVFVWDGIAIGAGAFTFTAFSMLAASVVGLAGLLVVIPLDLGLTGVWAGLVVFVSARWAALALWYRYGPLGRGRGPASQAA